MQSLIEECPSLLLGAAAYTQEALLEILKQPACQQLAAALFSASPPLNSSSMQKVLDDYHMVHGTETAFTLPATQIQPSAEALTGQNLNFINTTAQVFINTISNDPSDDLISLDARLFLTTIFVILTFMGIVGNLMVITVVLKVPGMITPTNCYLMSLAASDCLFFVGAAPTELAMLHQTSDYYMFGPIGCAFFTYIPYLAINSSSLSITAFTIERFIGICYPLRARYICTVSRAKLIIICIWFFCFLYNSPWLYLATIVEDTQYSDCTFKLKRGSLAYKLVYSFDFTTFYLIPMILYVIIYAKITYTLTACSMNGKGRQPFRKLAGRNGSEHTNQRNGLINGGDSLHKYSVSNAQPLNPKKSLTASSSNDYARNSFVSAASRKGSTRGRVQVQVIKMLAVVVLIFAVCWFPYRAMVMYNSFAPKPFNPVWYIMFAKTMIFFNCAINPILYNVMSARFRNAFRRLLRGKNADGKDSKRNCTITMSQPLTTMTSTMRPDDLKPFLSPCQSPEHEEKSGSATELMERV